MVKIQGSIHFNKKEEKVASIVASIARLSVRRSFHRMIGWYRRIKNPLAFHELNANTVRRMGKQLKLSGLVLLADEFQVIIDKNKPVKV